MSEKPKIEPTPFEKMRALAASVVAVPKAEVDKAEKKWRKERGKKRPKAKQS